MVDGGGKLVRGGDANTAVTALFVLDSYSAPTVINAGRLKGSTAPFGARAV